MKAFRHFFSLAITGLILLSSCGDEATCVDRDTSLVKIDFIGQDGLAKDITLNSVSAIGDNDGFPDLRDTTVNSLALPLNPAARTATFILYRTDTTDTIGFSYDVVAQLISPECGLDAAFSKLDTTRVTFANTVILSRIINEQISTNLEITH